MRIAILKPSALGDIVHALPVLTALRHRLPGTHLTWVVNKAYEPLLAGHPHLDATLPFDRAAIKRWDVLGVARFAHELRKQRFDLVLDMQGLLRTGLMCGFSGAPRKVGFANAREGATRFYTDRIDVPDAESIHAVDRYWKFAEWMGAATRPKEFVVPLKPLEVAAVDRELIRLPRPWVAVAVGARWETKRWPAGHFAELLSKVQRTSGGSVLFVGTSADTFTSQTVANALPGPHADLTGNTTLPRLAAALSRSDLMIGNDTGPLHLAAALGVRCVAPYTCTSPTKHGPYGQPGGVPTSVSCGGGYLKRCPHAYACFADLTPARLWPAVAEGLRPWLTRSRSA